MGPLVDYLVQYGDIIGYAVVGVVALLVLSIVQLARRRRDLSRARTAVRLVTYSICPPRQGPVAVRGTYRESAGAQWIECSGQRVECDGGVEIVCGTRGHWRRGTRTYALRDRDEVIAIGVMSRAQGASWHIAPSPAEMGVQLYALTPKAAPAPLWPWRAPLILAIAGGIAFGGMYEAGDALGGASCERRLELQITAALPLTRAAALAKLKTCPPSVP